MKIIVPDQVLQIINTLEEAGFEAYAVGGCVRDSILGREPNDWDITTSARPEEVKELFARTIDTGIQHGTVTVMLGKEGYEVTTYRIDGEYEDSRHPKEVTFTASLKEDLKRRDFTINAMAYSEKDGLIDYFDGVGDIQKGLIRCVGCAEERFSEDALRMMRAVRFSAQLGYQIEENTKEAIKKLAPNLGKISAERIQAELVKMLISDHPDYLRICYETGMTKVFLPEFDIMMKTVQNNPHHFLSVGEHTLLAMQKVKPQKALRLAMLFHDMGKPVCRTTDEDGVDHFYGHQEKSREISKEVLKRLKFDNDTIDRVGRLVLWHDLQIETGQKYMRRAMNRLGEDIFPDIFEIKRADAEAQSSYKKKEKEENLQELLELYEQIKEAGQCICLKDLAVSGKDLIAAGMEPGKAVGAKLSQLLELVIEDPSKNTREFLLSQL